MIQFSERLDTLAGSGKILHNMLRAYKTGDSKKNIIDGIIEKAAIENPWFSQENIVYAFANIVTDLEKNNLDQWIEKYKGIDSFRDEKKVGVIMAGNIPFVGWRDMLAVLLSGNRLVAKLSARDKVLIKFIAEVIVSVNPAFAKYIQFEEGGLGNFDAIIATGSNNSSRYFDYYFGKYPNIIRKNRNSVAVISQNEKDENLKLLADDVFIYFGLGCRNVSKIFVPVNFNFERLFEAFAKYRDIINHNKYASNYVYNRAVFLVNRHDHLDNGFLLVKEDTEIASPVGVLYYEIYNDIDNVKEKIFNNKNNIQCVVSASLYSNKTIKFGSSQKPELCDYADDIDVLKFLINL